MESYSAASDSHYLQVNDLKKMILGANYFFDREKEYINSLNVFPVPDGDTGTNMSMTLKAAVEGTLAYDGLSIGELSEIMASKAMMGARGNSGVILSQILRGIARGLRKKDYISPGELSKAFQYGVVYAYRAVSKPVEGTILTVAREMARGIRTAARKGENLYGAIEAAVNSGKNALAKTTDMLPSLKEAGVVDAGGLGLLVFFEGCLYAMKQSFHDLIHHMTTKTHTEETSSPIKLPFKGPKKPNLEYPYCTETLIKAESGGFDSLKDLLFPFGDSLLVVIDKNVAKIHIHTASPDLVIMTALRYGSLHDIKIENMNDQNREVSSSAAEITNVMKDITPGQKAEGAAGIISVSFGEGFRDIFLSLGADQIVLGGQTMNPKVEDLLNAVNKLPQQSAIILPNNRNIIMVAETVKTLTEKQVEVLKTKTLPEGLAALLAYNATQPVEDNIKTMLQGINRVKTGLVTYATRETLIKEIVVEPGQFLGLSGDDIITAGKDIELTALDLINNITTDDNDIITVFYGSDISREQALTLTSAIQKDYPSIEVELQYGGQPIYYYIISVE